MKKFLWSCDRGLMFVNAPAMIFTTTAVQVSKDKYKKSQEILKYAQSLTQYHAAVSTRPHTLYLCLHVHVVTYHCASSSRSYCPSSSRPVLIFHTIDFTGRNGSSGT